MEEIQCMYNIKLDSGEDITYVGFGIYDVMDNIVEAGIDKYSVLSIKCVDVV